MPGSLYCPECLREDHPSKAKICARDGTPLLPMSARDSLWIGLVLSEKYRILRFIDEGGTAEVFEAERIGTDKRVAVKLLHPTLSATGEEVQRFFQQVRLASLVAHPNVVAIEDFGSTPAGLHFIVMELLEGRSLATLLKAGPMPALVALRVAIRLCEGLAAAHERGVIHCDIKPGNVFLQDTPGQPEPIVKILDLGIGRFVAAGGNLDVDEARIAGTPDYMSPEQCQGRPLGVASDIYSTGVILHEMLFGTTPFVASSWVEVLSMHVHKAPVWPQEIADVLGLPSILAPIVLQMLSKDPSARPASMLDLQRELSHLARQIRMQDIARGGEGGHGARASEPPATLDAVPLEPVRCTCHAADEREGLLARIARMERVIADFQLRERRLATAEKMREALRDARSLGRVSTRILETVCVLTGTDAAALWLVEPDQQRLHCESLWCRPGAALHEFLEATRAMSFPRCRGLPGRVWASGEPAVIPDVGRDRNFPRADVARAAGLRCGFAVPIADEGEVTGVLEAFSRTTRAPDDEVMAILLRLGDQLGALHGREQARAELAKAGRGRRA